MAKKNPVLMPEAEEPEDTSKELMEECRDRYKSAEEYWQDDREAALDDIKFAAGDQWPTEVLSSRERDKRPCLTVDKTRQYVRQVVNDGRQNRPSIKVRPVDGGSDVGTAEVFQGLVKHVEDRSCADTAYDTSLEGSATCGQGYFRVETEYANDQTFEQEICIKRIRNPMSVIIDPMSQEADGSDMKYAFVCEQMSMEEFEEKYPGKKPEDWQTNESYNEWYSEKSVRIAEYWYVEEEEKTMHRMVDGTVIPLARFDELKEGGALELDSLIQETRKIPVRKVYHCLVSGAEVLSEPTEWPGKWIPIFPVWGEEIDIEGKVTHCGIIRRAKDPQRLYNYSRSAFAERVALTPKAPWLAAEGQVEDYSAEWRTANTENHSVLRYKPTSLNGTPVPPPQRINPSDVPAGFAQDMQISEHDIQGAIGMYNASLGAPSNERSGKAIMARQREGDVGTFHYHDNLNRAIRHCGRVLIDLIPKVYDTSRVVRILGYDGSTDQVQLNPDLPTASQKIGLKMMYNLTVGRYDVTTSTGPSYTTLRQEAAESMIQMVQANPELMGVIGDLMVKNMDWPGAEEISERLKLTLPPQILQAEQAKKQDSMPPEVQQIKQQFDMALQEKDQMLEQAMAALKDLETQLDQAKSDQQSKMADVQVKQGELQIKAAELQIKEFEAQTDRMEVMSKAENEQMSLQIQAMQPVEQPEVESEPEEKGPDVAALIQAIAQMMQNQPPPIVNVTVEKGGAVRKEVAIQAPSGQMYTGVINEQES